MTLNRNNSIGSKEETEVVHLGQNNTLNNLLNEWIRQQIQTKRTRHYVDQYSSVHQEKLDPSNRLQNVKSHDTDRDPSPAIPTDLHK